MLKRLSNEFKFQANVARGGASKDFLEAARVGDLERIQRFISAHAQNKYVHDARGDNALMLAARYGHEHVVKWLIKEGYLVDLQNQDGHTALYLAAINEYLTIFETLVNADANITLVTNTVETITQNKEIKKILQNALFLKAAEGKHDSDLAYINEHRYDERLINKVDHFGNTALNRAVIHDRLAIVQSLLETEFVEIQYIEKAIKDAENNKTMLELLQKHLRKTKERHFLNAIRNGVLPGDYRSFVEAIDWRGDDAFLIAAEHGYGVIVDALIARDLVDDVNKQNHSGDSALHKAARNGHFSIVQLLVESGADINLKNNRKETALDLAKDHQETKDFLQKKHFLQAARDRNNQDLEFVKSYIKDHANVLDIEDEKHNNALDIAVMSGRDQIARLLVSELDISQSQFVTAMEKAENHSKVILKKGYLLQAAKNNNDLEFIQTYIKNNFKALKIKDKENNNALDIAVMHGYFAIVQTIVDEIYVSVEDLRVAIEKAKTVKNNEKIVDFLQLKLQKTVTNSYINYKSKAHFFSEGYLDKDKTFSHITSKVKKAIPEALKSVPTSQLPQKYKNRWYLKEVKDTKSANREVVAQEIFRLLSPGHPKTRVVIEKNDEHDHYFVASKEIKGGYDLPHTKESTNSVKAWWNHAFKKGTITGIGEVTTIARLMHETDLKNGNLKVDYLDRLIKFDGDWCFSSLRNKSSVPAPITEETIASLPFSEDGTPHHWLGCVYMGYRVKDKFLDDSLSTHPRVRAEINYALLKIMLLPPALVKNLIAFYVNNPHESKEIYDDFMDRKNQMFFAAMKNSSFIKYLKSDLAKTEFTEYVSYLKTFKTTGKTFVFDLISDPEKQFLDRFDQIQNASLDLEAQTSSMTLT